MGDFGNLMNTQAAGAIGNAATGVLGMGLGMIAGKAQDKRQLTQQGKLMNQQIVGNKDMMDYSMQKQYEMWLKTGYGGQMDQMKKAGLNPALMYGMSGGGGATTGSATGSVQGGSAPQGGGEMMQGMGMMMQNSLIDAQRRNIEAQTKKTEAETVNLPKTGAYIEAGTKNIVASTGNTEADTRIKEAQAQIAAIQQQIQGMTAEQQMQTITANSVKAIQEAQQAVNQTTISDQTKDDIIKTIKAQAIGEVLKNALTQAQTENVKAGTQKTEADTRLSTQAWSQNIEKLAIQWADQGIRERSLANQLREAGIDPTEKVMDMIIDGTRDIFMLKQVQKGNMQLHELKAPNYKPVTGFHR